MALHVRRGDVDATTRPKRFTSNEVIARQIEQIEHVLGSVTHEIHLYSEGEKKEFATLADKAVLHLNENVLESAHQMICADVLVMAKSSLSYVVAMLSEGIKIYTPFHHPPQGDWIVCAKDGTIPNLDLETVLSSYRQA